MKFRTIIPIGILIIMIIGIGMVLTKEDSRQALPGAGKNFHDGSDTSGVHGKDEDPDHRAEYEKNTDHDDHDDHDEHDEHDEHDDDHLEEDHLEEDHASHEEDNKESQGLDEDPDIIEMSSAQKKEAGIVVDTARSGDIEKILTFPGEVMLNQDRIAHIVSLVSGIAREVSVSLGETVEDGQVLARIDSSELVEMKAAYLAKHRQLEVSQKGFERKDYLKKENIASEADWLEAKAAFQMAETAMLESERRLKVLGFSGKKLLAATKIVDETFGRFDITAPISGTIISRHITRGEKVDDQELFIVADLSMVWVDLQIPAKDIHSVKAGDRVEIVSKEGRTALGTLSLVGPVVNGETRSALGRIVLDNVDGYWIPGLFVKGQILTSTQSSSVVISSEAVQNIEGQNVVFVPEKDGFRPVEITLGKSNAQKIQILAGLSHGDVYVSKGAFALKSMMVTSGTGGHAGHGH